MVWRIEQVLLRSPLGMAVGDMVDVVRYSEVESVAVLAMGWRSG